MNEQTEVGNVFLVLHDAARAIIRAMQKAPFGGDAQLKRKFC